MLNIVEANKKFESENNIIYPDIKTLENNTVKKKAKLSHKDKLDQVSNCLINNYTGRSTTFKILSFLPAFFIINNDQKIVELFSITHDKNNKELFQKVCNIFNLSEQTIHYKQWCIKNNGINQNNAYSDKKVLDILNKSVDSFYKYVGSNSDIFPNAITKINSNTFKVDHCQGGHFIVSLENKTKPSIVITTNNRDRQKLVSYLNGIKEDLNHELAIINKEYQGLVSNLKKMFFDYKEQCNLINSNNIENEEKYNKILNLKLNEIKANIKEEEIKMINSLKIEMVSSGYLPIVLESTKEYLDRVKGIKRGLIAKYNQLKNTTIQSITPLQKTTINTKEIAELKNKVISAKIKRDKLKNKISELNLFNFDHFITALKYQLNNKEGIVINLLSDKKTDNYLNINNQVSKVKIKDLKKNIKRILLLSITGNNHIRNIKLVITNTLTFQIDEMINLCLMNTDDLGYPKLLNSQLTDNDYITSNNLYLLDHGCYFELAYPSSDN